MAAQSRPETVPPGTEVFSGPTLEGALAAARSVHGPRVKIVRALRVRQGVRGLLGHSRYDVHASVPETVATVPDPPRQPAAAAPSRGWRRTPAPPPPPARPPPPGARGRTPAPPPPPARPAASPIDVLAGLVDAADARERAAAAEPTWAWSGEAEVGALLTDVAALGAALREQGLGHPSPDLARHESPPRPATGTAPVAAPSETQGEASAWRDLLVSALQPASAAPRPLVEGLVAPAEPEPPCWSRNDLRGIGVPAAVLRRLPVEDPRDDGGWRHALREAIAAVVPEPREPDPDHPVVVSGHGLAGVVAILRACVEDGASPGTISFHGRRRQASAGALVEVLAACARS